MDTLLAVRPCGCAVACVAADSSEVPWARTTWTARGWQIVTVPGPDVAARLHADFIRHTTRCHAHPAHVQTAMAL